VIRHLDEAPAVAKPARREREDAGPSFATLAVVITAAVVPAGADAVTSGPLQPNDTAAEETLNDRSVQPAEGAVEVTQDHDPARPGTDAGRTTGQSDETAATDNFEVGPVIPGYEIEDELGRGGMGIVYKARNLRLNRAVALKMILAGAHAGREAAFRFVNEAEAVARVQHPNIVQIFHIDQHGGHPYFEMEFIGGGSLADRLDGTPLPARDAARLVEALARAMAEAHRQGVVHRDLKPGNILLTPEGIPKVADFGLAKLLTAESGLTRTDSVLGSPSYMAPEQAEGKTREVGPAADLYALGAILYEMLTGRPPFRGATVLDTLQQVKTAEPVPPSRLVPGLPRDVETIALKCLAKDPGKRYESATALADDLRRFEAGEPIAARPVGSVEQAGRWIRRHRAAVALIVATGVAGLALVAAGISLAYSGQLQRANALTEQQRALAVKAQGEAREALALARRYLYFLRVNQAGAAWYENALDRTAALLDECPPEQRDWEWHFLDQRRHSNLLVLKRHTGSVTSVAYSPDGRRLASASRDQTVKVSDAGTGELVLTLRGHSDYVRAVAFSPDGLCIATASVDGTVKVWDAATGLETFTLSGHTSPVWDVAYSPDGRCIASTSFDGTVKVWDAEKGKVMLTLRGHTGVIYRVAYSPDGRRLASAGQDGTVKVWDVATRQELMALPGHTSDVASVAYSPDGRRIASSSLDQTVKIWDAATGQELRTLCGHTKSVDRVAYSPDGRRLASASMDGKVKVWDAATGQELLTLRGHSSGVASVAYSPDGRRLASASQDQTVRVWDVVTGQEALTLRGVLNHQGGLAYSPDGHHIASAGQDRTVKVWDAATGQDVLTLRGHTSFVLGVAYSPDGRRIASTSQNGEMKVCDAVTGEVVLTLNGQTGSVCGVAYSPDGRRLASAGQDGTVKVWDAATGQELLTLRGHTGPAFGVAYMPSPSLAPALPSGGHTGSVVGVAYSPDGRRLASTGLTDRTVKVWDAATGQELLTLRGHLDSVRGVTYSPDGRRIASTSVDRTVKVWDAATGQELLTLRAHTGFVFGAAYSPDGRRLASAGQDGTVKVWDAATGQELLTLREHTGPVFGVAYSPDGHHIASASFDQTVKVWDGTPMTPAWHAERLPLADRRWLVWQRQEAEECERQKQWFAAVWHLNQLLARNPDDDALRARRDAARDQLEAEQRQRQGPELPVDVFSM
jgi:WD40 repeat protein/tRNA A-37 threonylcarbamoyl transferase component Bud32